MHRRCELAEGYSKDPAPAGRLAGFTIWPWRPTASRPYWPPRTAAATPEAGSARGGSFHGPAVTGPGLPDPGPVGPGPVGEGRDRLAQAGAERGQRVLDPGRHLGEDTPLDQPGPLQLTQGPGEHLPGDPADLVAQPGVGLGPVEQPAGHQHSPLVGDQDEGGPGGTAGAVHVRGALVGLSRYVRHAPSIPRAPRLLNSP